MVLLPGARHSGGGRTVRTMTMTTHARPTSRDSLNRLVRCSSQDAGTDRWWTCLSSSLHDLHLELMAGDVQGLAAQVIEDAPELGAAATRLPHLDARVRAELADLRALVAEHFGAAALVPEIRGATEALLRRVRTLYRLSDDLLLDAYERDFGGE